MATQETPAFEDLEPVEPESNEDDYETEWIELDRGEKVVGEVRSVNPNCGDYNTTVLELARGLGDVVSMWSNGQIDRVFEEQELGEGDVVGILHTEETRSFVDDDGNEVEYDNWEVRVLE
ncbi:hypothetical protein [Natranaeroarchaeum aerophilus]|uniref:Uncharacterized protein n=1 Tax=Natranaeroarchaeum aerophilus TaxID=2917711 RepID=A0AAE3FNU1_9EURY|nr:hypothetical protein [Natranaeroarchaeum aerophilus]MCL9812514.1 hypothetical protein [Natranaeroarchaeum aerophilus]